MLSVLPPLPENRIIIQGGGNAGNALTCAARLGLKPRLISKVADDSQGKGILEELEADGVDSSFVVVSEGTYIIVDDQTIRSAPMIPDDLPESNLLESLDGVKIVYFDGRLHETALVLAQETWTGAPSVPNALVSMLLKFPNIKFIVVTVGEDGCIMLERSVSEDVHSEEIDVDDVLETLKQKMDRDTTLPTHVASADIGCRALGARTGLPQRTDPRMTTFLI